MEILLQDIFEKENYQTIAILRDYSKLKLFQKKFHQNFLVIENILDYEKTKKIIKSVKPDILINCLGITNKEITITPKQIEKL